MKVLYHLQHNDDGASSLGPLTSCQDNSKADCPSDLKLKSSDQMKLNWKQQILQRRHFTPGSKLVFIFTFRIFHWGRDKQKFWSFKELIFSPPFIVSLLEGGLANFSYFSLTFEDRFFCPSQSLHCLYYSVFSTSCLKN